MVTVITLKRKNIKLLFTCNQLQPHIIKQFCKYLGSGSAATTVHYILLILLVEFWSWNAIIASSVGFVCGALTGFTLNKKFVFRDAGAGKIACLKYFIMSGIGAIFNILLLWILIHVVHLYYLLAQLIATGSIVVGNFTCCKLWIFNKG